MKALTHFCKFLLSKEEPHSQVTEAELAVLIAHSRYAQTIVEIGCYEGKTSVALAQNCTGTVYSIDPFVKGRLNICYGEAIAKTHARRHGIKNLRLLKGYSFDIARQFHLDVDLLFIDGDHSHEGIKQDWFDWMPKMRRGGLIGLHDSRQAINSVEYVGSMQFYEQYISNLPNVVQIDAVDSLVVVQVI